MDQQTMQQETIKQLHEDAKKEAGCYIPLADYLGEVNHPRAEDLATLANMIACETDLFSVSWAIELFDLYLDLPE